MRLARTPVKSRAPLERLMLAPPTPSVRLNQKLNDTSVPKVTMRTSGSNPDAGPSLKTPSQAQFPIIRSQRQFQAVTA